MDSTAPDFRNKLEYLLLASIPFVMAASSVSGINFGPVRHTGLMWMVTIVVGFFLLPLKGHRRIVFPWLGWLPFYLFYALSLSWTPLDWKVNIQLGFQMLAYPVVGMIASYRIKSENDLSRFNVYYIVATVILGLFCLYFMAGPGRAMQSQSAGLYSGFAERPAATSLIVVAAMFLAQIHRIPKTSICMWLFCFVICIVSESRMATLVLLMLWLIHPQLASVKTRIILTIVVMLAGLAAFNTPIIQDRFFKSSSGFSGQGSLEDVAKGKFDSAGRFDAWPIVLKKSADTPWLGHGLGESAPFVYSVWAPMDKPHNEYLKMLYEGGYIGLAVFVLGLISTMVNLSINIFKDKGRNWATSAAFMGWIGFILMAIVDNPLVYGNNFLQPLFFLVGAANGISASLAQNSDGTILQDSNSQDNNSPDTASIGRKRPIMPILLR